MTMLSPSPEQRRTRLIQTVAFALTGVATVIVVIPVAVVTFYVIQHGASGLSWQFLTGAPERAGREGGFLPVIVLTFYALILVAVMAVPPGLLCAIYLSEYARPGRLLRVINITVVNLAGVPSIVYGLFGVALFLGVLGAQKALWVASATLALQALAIIITSAREALLAVPPGIREGSLALGVSKLRTTMFVTVPQALPGIITGVLLAISRSAGETAPILVVGAILATDVSLSPTAIWNQRAQMLSFELYHRVTEGLGFPDDRRRALAVVLLSIVLALNLAALALRFKISSLGVSGRN